MICVVAVCLVVSLTVSPSELCNLIEGMALGLKKAEGRKLTGYIQEEKGREWVAAKLILN